MIMSVLPLKKLRRNVRYLFGVILVVGIVAVFHAFVAANTWSNDHQHDLTAWRSRYIAQPWKAEYKGQANLHVFEDWCGSSIDQLRKNLHYPLYPHIRTTVVKLAVSPQWTNYGLRIFGYLHPYVDGKFVFAVSSQANSEFWLSTNESPLDCRLLAWVGKTGSEWTAPGEYNKFASQTSKPVWLSAQRKYFFELIHKQGDRATDHVELAWKINQEGLRFMVISSKHISIYTSESMLLMSDVDHIPQTTASHASKPLGQPGNKPGYQADDQPCDQPSPDMLREDPRDTFYQMPLISGSSLRGTLPDCTYSPSYIIKGYRLLRYQGLQFVHMTYIYPNDYTRLTHMETENGCFYHESADSLRLFGLSRYMRMDRLERYEDQYRLRDFHIQQRDEGLVPDEEEDHQAPTAGGAERRWEAANNGLPVEYGNDYDVDAQRPGRSLLSRGKAGKHGGLVRNGSDAELRVAVGGRDRASLRSQPHSDGAPGRGVHEPIAAPQPRPIPSLIDNRPKQQKGKPRDADRREEAGLRQQPVKADLVHNGKKALQKTGKNIKLRPARTLQTPAGRRQAGRQQRPPVDPVVHKRSKRRLTVKRSGGEKLQVPTGVPQQNRQNGFVPQQAVAVTLHPDLSASHSKPSKGPHLPALRINPYRDPHQDLPALGTKPYRDPHPILSTPAINLNKRVEAKNTNLRDRKVESHVGLQPAENTTISTIIKSAEAFGDDGEMGAFRGGKKESVWAFDGNEEDTTYEEVAPTPLLFDPEVVWSQTFQVDQLDLQLLRSDWIDLNCNVSGNMLLHSSDAQAVVKDFMVKLNFRHKGRFTLVRVVNVEKRVDRAQGNRYLLELEIKDTNGQLRRLSHYVYSLVRWKKPESKALPLRRPIAEVILCNPFGFQWNPTATVHFIVPVKNQARWVIQLISDMEELYRVTRDHHFSLIIVDYDSTDMDVKKALKAASLPQYEYLKLSGNFQRAAGLQAGVDLITDNHSIVFLCDLHIYFPMSILDSIRKHCVEGHMAFAPILMRLKCGATPQEPRGYWEVNGFGLLSVYKSDLLAAGGMNTREFTDRWGGEDWELLDRILQSGLEVERIHLRNFFHYYHSKRGMWNRRTMPNSR
ncbi:unnamed protein product [Lota lota]